MYIACGFRASRVDRSELFLPFGNKLMKKDTFAYEQVVKLAEVPGGQQTNPDPAVLDSQRHIRFSD